MCIRDSSRAALAELSGVSRRTQQRYEAQAGVRSQANFALGCLLYTSDAADERTSVDLGGRRIIKQTKQDRLDGVTCIIDTTNRRKPTQALIQNGSYQKQRETTK